MWRTKHVLSLGLKVEDYGKLRRLQYKRPFGWELRTCSVLNRCGLGTTMGDRGVETLPCEILF